MKGSQLQKFSKRLQKLGKVATSKTFIYSFSTYLYHQISFSLEGEDCILKKIFRGQKTGFYVDVGAHHPQRFSNTYIFYLQGWRGINIDAMPGSMDLFRKIRPKDINLEVAISDSQQELTYYMFDEPALNGFSEELCKMREASNVAPVIDKQTIKTQTLSAVLDKYLPAGQAIDFLSIDVEGLDYQILLSNDWTKYRPKIVLVEELEDKINTSPSKIETFLRANNYDLVAKTIRTSFYKCS